MPEENSTNKQQQQQHQEERNNSFNLEQDIKSSERMSPPVASSTVKSDDANAQSQSLKQNYRFLARKQGTKTLTTTYLAASVFVILMCCDLIPRCQGYSFARNR